MPLISQLLPDTGQSNCRARLADRSFGTISVYDNVLLQVANQSLTCD